MSNVKVAVIYYSSTGTNYRLAQAAEEGAKEAGAEVRLRRVQELAPQAAIESNPAWKAHLEATKDVPVATLDDLEWADAYIFSTPTRFGNVSSQMKQFLDTAGPLWAQGKLANKVATAMSSASNFHGGQEATVLSLYTTLYHWGTIVVTPGYTDPVIFTAGGNPYGTTATVNDQLSLDDKTLAAAKYQAKRVVEIARKLKG
ncbi:MAG: NAD(P)H:quinone oxidoreductase [Alicyclobacillaceae bacterium]|nr:NAD(P)H:quinone oxidoreductase [Alicyclobacillaceae bacterium]